MRALAARDVDSAARILASALADDPFLHFLLPEAAARSRALERDFRPLTRLYFANDLVTGIGDPLAGVAIWDAPQSNLKPAGISVLYAGAKLAICPLGRAFFRHRRLIRRIEDMRRQWAPAPHYHLISLAVEPSFQRRGLGESLIRPVLKKADAERAACYCESMNPRNLSFYARCGFEMMETHPVPESSLTIHALLRKPQT